MDEGIILNERYKLLERIGLGGMASVYRAEDLVLGRIVAIKMLHEGLLGDATFVKQFRQEAHSAANLTHPNIVTIHDIGQHEHRSYIVMEYVEGLTLKQVIREAISHKRYLPINRVLDLLIQVCRGMGYAHRSGVVHCDIKPQNVIVTADDRVKVTDFGIARAVTQASGAIDTSGVSWGTPQYFSPEQAAGEPPTPASDVYSIGIMLYEGLTNKLPFHAESPTAVALKHLNTLPPNIRSVNAHVPEQLAKIVHKILDKEPSGRYRTAGQLERILTTYRKRDQPAKPAPAPIVVSKAEARKTRPKRETIPKLELPIRESQLSEQSIADSTTVVHQPVAPAVEEPAESDWVAVSLGITAVVALLGLIPLWVVVARAWGVF